MLNKTEWLTKNRVIYQQYSGDITLEDMQVGRNAMRNLIANRSKDEKHKLHIIIDLTLRITVPTDVMNLNTMRELFAYEGKGISRGWFLIVRDRPNPILRFFVLAASKALGFRLRIVPSLDYAQTFLRRVDTSLLENSAQR